MLSAPQSSVGVSDVPVVAPTGAEQAAVALWQARVLEAKRKWDSDHQRARECMEFVKNMQWPGQTSPDTELYVANLVQRMVNQKVATLYAKNPEAEFQRRPRLDFAIWDEKQETLEYAIMQLQSGSQNPAAQLLIADYLNGRNFRTLCDSIGKSLKLLYDVQIDLQDFSFKRAMKQLVRRAIVCGVAFVKLDYERDLDPSIKTQSLETRLRDLNARQADLEAGKFDLASAEFDASTSLAASVSQEFFSSAGAVSERLVFDFPSSLSVIVDPRCTNFVDFVGASWIAVEYLMTADEVNSFFELPDNEKVTATQLNDYPRVDATGSLVRVYELFDKRTRTQAFFAECGKGWLRPPTPLPFNLNGFWPIAALVFNNPEVEELSQKMRVSCWPLSDVFLWRSAQIEWNRRRNSMSRHRLGASPKIALAKGALTAEDKRALETINPDAGITVVELEGLPPDGDINRLMQAVQHPPVSAELYDTSMLQQDMLLTVGEQSSDLGAQNINETATGQTIAAHSKSVATSSNIDDLDDLLSWCARRGGEILLSQMPVDTVKQLIGVGAVWPRSNVEQFNSIIYLQIKAASSGKPNKALHLQNVRELFPILMQLGANPAFLVREALTAYDERINTDEAFPLLPPDMGRPQTGILQSSMSPDVPQPTSGADAPPPNLPTGTAVPSVVATNTNGNTHA